MKESLLFEHLVFWSKKKKKGWLYATNQTQDLIHKAVHDFIHSPQIQNKQIQHIHFLFSILSNPLFMHNSFSSWNELVGKYFFKLLNYIFNRYQK